MAGNDGAGSILALAMRVARLDASGAPVPGANNAYVTDTLVKIDFEEEYDTGDEVTKKNGAGRICLSYKADDTLKRLKFGLTICAPDPELYELLSGGVVITAGGDSIGYAPPKVGGPSVTNGVSIEAWSRAQVGGAAAASRPYIRWPFPLIKLTRKGRTLESDAMDNPFEGFGYENPNFGNGPFNDWPYVSDRLYMAARESTLPTATVGYVSTPAQI